MEIVLQNIGKQFKNGTRALDHVTFTIPQGEFVSVIGPSGAGKTTLFRILNGMETPGDGAVLFDGSDISSMSGTARKNVKRSIGTIYQDFCLVENSTCLANVLTACLPDMGFFPAVFGIYGKKRREEALKFLDRVGLLEKSEEPVKNLSGGQKQRVAIGSAIIRKPKAFLMDEPLSNLDAKLRVQMRIEISKLHENLGATIIYVTHDQTEAMTLGTRIVVMKDGVVQQVDTPQALYNTPCNLFVAGFIGSPQMNFMDAKCTIKGNDVTLTVGKHVLKVPASKKQALIDGGYDGKTVVLGIRPEDVHDSQAFISNSPDSVIESTIKVYELLGAEVFLYFDLEGTQMTARVNPRTTLRTGDHAVFALDMEKIHLFDKDTELTITN